MIGLDIGEKHIKIAVVTEDRILCKYKIAEILERPEETTAQAVTRTITEAFRGLEPEDKEVFTSINGSNVVARRITLPPMPESEIKNAAYWEAKNFITFPIEEATIDYYMLGETASKAGHMLEVMVIAVRSQALRELVASIEEAGLKCAGVTIESFPLYELIKPKLEIPKDEAVALVDIGQKTTGLSLFKNNLLQFSRVIGVGGSNITQSLVSTLKIEAPRAEEIKIKFGLPDAETADPEEASAEPEVRDAMVDSLGGLLKELVSSFDYYRNQYFEEKIRQIYLCGGSSVIRNLPGYLMERLLIKVEFIDLPLNLSAGPDVDKEKLKSDAPRLSLAVGLGLNQCREINLIKVKEVKKVSQIKFAKMMEKISIPTPVVVGLLVLILSLITAVNIYLNFSLDSAKREIEAETQVLEKVTKLQERRTILSIIEKREIKVQEIIKHLAALLPEGTTLTSLMYENESMKMEVAGEAPDAKAASLTLNRIEDSTYFTNTRLEEIRKIEGATYFRITFKVE